MENKTEVIRKSFGLKDQIRPQLEASYRSSLIDQIKAGGFRYNRGRVTVYLAEEFGFCYGVDRAIDYAYETRAKFPGRRIFLTSEIIHNPRVNSNLKDCGIQFLSGPYAAGVSINDVRREDVVLLPAFGTTLLELEELRSRGCILVDTTCGSVMSVWKRVDSYARDGFTSIIHGKYEHEETKATSSRALAYPEGKYLIVLDKEQARIVCGYIEGRQERAAFLEAFENSMSPGFDPDKDLKFIGCANQTTMLSSESLEIANMLQRSIAARYGEEAVASQFRHFDTICSATQDRQDAVMKLVREKPDLMIVVGGFNSSNTGHLLEISLNYCPAYHVKDADCLISRRIIRHKKAFSSEIMDSENWLPEGPIRLGVTAGASTPNRVIEEVIERILEFANS